MKNINKNKIIDILKRVLIEFYKLFFNNTEL